jgi:hypothetical protein
VRATDGNGETQTASKAPHTPQAPPVTIPYT